MKSLSKAITGTSEMTQIAVVTASMWTLCAVLIILE
jgi:hypothetical protein